MSGFEISKARRESKISEKIIYQVFLRTFTPEGTIRAATRKLSHIASLGVDIVYVVSCCKADGDENREYWSPRQRQSGIDNPRNPYRICDYFRIDEEYGDESDLKEFVDTAHSLGLLVMWDLVYMHCGPSEFPEKNPDFVCRDENGELIYNSYHFPNLDFDNPKLREYLWENMLYWVREFDIDGYRCDVGDEIPLDFWREGRRRIEQIKPKFLMLNEGEKAEYLVDVFDASYDFLWGKCIRRAVRGEYSCHDLRCASVGVAAKHPDGALVLRAYENHDYTNDSYENRLDRIAPENADAATVINFLLDGVPFLYNGNEFADCRRHSMWRLGGDEFCMDWSRLDSETGRRRMALVRELCRLRHEERALCYGETLWEKTENIAKFVRELDREKICVAANFQSQPVTVPTIYGEILISGRVQITEAGVTLLGGGYIAVRQKEEV